MTIIAYYYRHSAQHPDVKWLWFPLTAAALLAFLVWLVLMNPHWWSASPLRTCGWALYTSKTVTSEICIGVKCDMLHILMSLWCKSILHCCCCSYSRTVSQRICRSAVTGPSRCNSSVLTSVQKNIRLNQFVLFVSTFPLCFFAHFITASAALLDFLCLSHPVHLFASRFFFGVAGNPLPALGFESLLNLLARCSDRLNLNARVPSL